jgi:hypothetical protein
MDGESDARTTSLRNWGMADKASIASFLYALRAQWSKYLTTVIVTAFLIFASAFLPDQVKFATELILVVGILIVTYWIWAAEREKVIELEKIDRTDLERMLHGRFFDRTFIYGAEIVLCKDYKGPVGIGRLRNGFDTIMVGAPKHSVAGIRIKFFHRRNADQYLFEYRDGNNRVVSISNIHEDQQIFLDGQSSFGLRLTMSEDFLLDEASLVRVTVATWTK